MNVCIYIDSFILSQIFPLMLFLSWLCVDCWQAPIHYQGSVQARNLRDALAEAKSDIKVKANNYLHLTLIYRTFTCLGSYMVTLYDIGRSREGFLLFCWCSCCWFYWRERYFRRYLGNYFRQWSCASFDFRCCTGLFVQYSVNSEFVSLFVVSVFFFQFVATEI